DELYSFSAFNLFCFSLAILKTLRSNLNRGQKFLIIICFSVTTFLYVRWPHPEVYTSSLLLIALLYWLEVRLESFLVCVALASWQNPTAILAAVLLGRYFWTDQFLKKILPGVWVFLVLAAIPYAYAFGLTGKVSIIGSSSFVDILHVSWDKWL